MSVNTCQQSRFDPAPPSGDAAWMAVKKKRRAKRSNKPALPPEHDWRTSDEDELLKRRLRAGDEKFRTLNDPVWSAELIPLLRGGFRRFGDAGSRGLPKVDAE